MGQEKYVITVTDDVFDSLEKISVSINIFDYTETDSLGKVPADFVPLGEKAYLVAWSDTSQGDGKTGVIDGDEVEGPFAISEVELNGQNIPKTVEINTFGSTGFNQLTSDKKAKIRVRLVHTSKDASDLTAANFASNPDGQYGAIFAGIFDDYSITSSSGSHPTSQALNEDGSYNINLKQAHQKQFELVLDFSGVSTADRHAIAGGKTYVQLDATNAEGNQHYYRTIEVAVTDEMLAAATDNKVRIPFDDAWYDNQKYSKNWQKVEATVYTKKNKDSSITPGAKKIEQNDGVEATLLGGYTFVKDMGDNKLLSSTLGADNIERLEYVLKLGMPTMDPAKTPSNVLGDAVEYGIVADTYDQSGHTETNFAVRTFKHDDVNMDIEGSGQTDTPFWVGNITNGLRFGVGTSANIDVYCTEDDTGKVSIDGGNNNNISIQTIVKTTSEINAEVTRLINAGIAHSSEYAGKTTLTLKTGATLLDLGDLPDSKTVFVRCENSTFENMVINKKPNQTIVFNVPGSSPTIRSFTVYEYKTDGSLSSTPIKSDGIVVKNADHAANVLVDEKILRHFVFNAYEATSGLTISDAAGIFLAPNISATTGDSPVVSYTNGAGWIATPGKVKSSAEWHFYYFDRTYHKVQLEGQEFTKKVEGNGYNSDTEFTFDLYVWADDKGNNCEAYDKAITSSIGGTESSDTPALKEKVEGQAEPQNITIDGHVAGRVTYTLKAGQKLVIKNLEKKYNDKDTKYRLIERNLPEGYTDNTQGYNGYASVKTQANYINTYNEGDTKDLSFKKVVVNAGNIEEDNNYEFTLFLWTESEGGATARYEEALTATKSEYEGTAPILQSSDEQYSVGEKLYNTKAYTVNLQKNQVLTIKDLPRDVHYAFREVVPGDAKYKATSGTLTGTVNEDGGTRQDYTNTYTAETVELTVTKEVFVDNATTKTEVTALANKEFTFVVKNSAGNYLTNDTTVPATFGAQAQAKKFTVTQSSSTGTKVVNLPKGQYTVEELSEGRDVTGYAFDTTSGQSATADLTGGNGSAKLINRYTSVVDVEVVKAWKKANGSPMDSWPSGKTVKVYLQTVNSEGTATNVFPEKTLTLNGVDGENNKFTGLAKYDSSNNPIIYTVREDSVADFVCTSVTQTSSSNNTITVTNTHTAAPTSKKLKVAKALKLKDTDTVYTGTWPSEGFTFTLAAASDNPAEGSTLPTGNGTTVTVHDATAAEFGEIGFTKAGTYKFTITENVPATPNAHVTYASGSVTATVVVGYDSNDPNQTRITRSSRTSILKRLN